MFFHIVEGACRSLRHVNVDIYWNDTECFLHLTHLCTMMNWLATLPYHNYDVVPAGSPQKSSPFLVAHRLLEEKSTAETSLQVQNNKDCVVDEVRVDHLMC